MDKVLALDIGGTSVKCGIVSEKGELFCREQCEVQGGPLLLAVKNAVKVQLKNAQSMGVQLCGVAAAVTGQIDTVNGVVAGTNGAIPGWEGVRLREELQLESGLDRVLVENDANCAAYIEAVKGAGAGKRNILTVTLGTGIGGGIVSDRKLFRGARGLAGEIGHICVERNGRPCSCGRRGCWERYASVSALVQDAALAVGDSGTLPKNGKEVFDLEKAGNEKIHRAVEQYFDFLGLGLTDLIHCLNPDRIVLGGGISAEGQALCDRLMLRLNDMVMPRFLEGLSVCTAEYRNEAGMLGAAELFFDKEWK